MKHLESYVVVIETDDAADFEQAYDWLDSALDKVQGLEGVEATQHSMAVDASAAPDLLEALNGLMEACNLWIADGGHLHTEEWEDAESAVAKAEVLQ